MVCKGLRYGVSICEACVIAVVDDDESFRDALERSLRTHGFQVGAFASGEEVSRLSNLFGCVRDSGPCEAGNERS